MNDFTKEELIELRECAKICSCDSAVSNDYYDDILIKIQSLIDNYCDHENYRKDEWMICICNKCHKVIVDE